MQENDFGAEGEFKEVAAFKQGVRPLLDDFERDFSEYLANKAEGTEGKELRNHATALLKDFEKYTVNSSSATNPALGIRLGTARDALRELIEIHHALIQEAVRYQIPIQNFVDEFIKPIVRTSPAGEAVNKEIDKMNSRMGLRTSHIAHKLLFGDARIDLADLVTRYNAAAAQHNRK